ncbi:hypothetical protein [Bradyrhizobium monzae]|uniref:hypothetical protein n=1 Tax=Bradyrhizobium sp. Oc8 TaxID=2876780 RepID=UPI001F17AE28|nr:hypothetical protein [Bradyrhizobium sp. Oc8]
MLRVLGEEQHDFATGTLPGIAVLQPSRAIAKHGLAARALDLDETHAPTINNDRKSAATVSRMSEESLKAGCDFHAPSAAQPAATRYCFAAIASRQ